MHTHRHKQQTQTHTHTHTDTHTHTHNRPFEDFMHPGSCPEKENPFFSLQVKRGVHFFYIEFFLTLDVEVHIDVKFLKYNSQHLSSDMLDFSV